MIIEVHSNDNSLHSGYFDMFRIEFEKYGVKVAAPSFHWLNHVFHWLNHVIRPVNDEKAIFIPDIPNFVTCVSKSQCEMLLFTLHLLESNLNL